MARMSMPNFRRGLHKQHGKKKTSDMRWTAENDRKLLLIGLGKEIFPNEYLAITRMFDQVIPSKKAIQERLHKLRAEQTVALGELDEVAKEMAPILPVIPGDLPNWVPTVTVEEARAVVALMEANQGMDFATALCTAAKFDEEAEDGAGAGVDEGAGAQDEVVAESSQTAAARVKQAKAGTADTEMTEDADGEGDEGDAGEA